MLRMRETDWAAGRQHRWRMLRGSDTMSTQRLEVDVYEQRLWPSRRAMCGVMTVGAGEDGREAAGDYGDGYTGGGVHTEEISPGP